MPDFKTGGPSALSFSPRPADPQPIYNFYFPQPAPNPQPVTPTYDPQIEANTLYGRAMALFAGGFARIGGSPAPLVGPIKSQLDAGFVDIIVSFGVVVPVDGNRKVYTIYLDDEKWWSSATGWDGSGGLPGDSIFYAETADIAFRPGTLTQAVLSLESEHFPGDENAYRPQMLLEIRNLPSSRFLAKTKKPVPYVSADIGDVTDGADPFDGINLGLALERIAHSPWAGYTSGTFEAVNITDVVPAILIKDNFTIIDLCRSVTRIYRNIDLLQSDKLRIKDRGSNVSPDFVFDRDSIIGGENAVQIIRAGATAQRRELELLATDPDQDYTAVPSLAQIPRNPFVISAAVGKETITSPLVMDASTRQALVTYAQQYEENARKKVSLRVSAYGFEIEPGDTFALPDTVADGIDGEVFKCTQTEHGANYETQIEGEAILRCSIYGPEVDPFLAFVVLLIGPTGADESTTITDESPAVHGNATVIGGAEVDTGVTLFGQPTLLTDAGMDSDGLSYPADTDWDLSDANSDQFCVEAWVIPNTTSPTDSTIIGKHDAVPNLSWMLYVNTTGNGELQFLGSTGGGSYDWAAVVSSGLNWVIGTKYYCRADKDATGKVRLYRGVLGDATAPMIASVTPSNSALAATSGVLSLACNSASAGRTWPGNSGEFRITKGSSRNASDAGVPVPTGRFPRV